MKLKPYILLFLIIFTMSGCALKKTTEPRVSGNDLIGVIGFFQAYMETFNSRNMNMLMTFYAPNAEIYILGEEKKTFLDKSRKYVLGKNDLLRAMELKREGWESKNLRLVDISIKNTRNKGNLFEVDVIFEVNSTAWLGKYEVTFALEKQGTAYQIVKENI